ncbi:MAG: DUF6152 family protein [Vicinamibacterales bacterium]
MRNKLLAFLIAAASITAVSVPLFAHHGNAAYATATQITLKGTVTQWLWGNPHCFLKFDVKDETGKVINWAAEVSNPPDMVRAGWSKTSFKVGDEVTVVLVVAKNDLPVGRIRQVTLADGQVYRTGGGQAPPAAAPAAQP